MCVCVCACARVCAALYFSEGHEERSAREMDWWRGQDRTASPADVRVFMNVSGSGATLFLFFVFVEPSAGNRSGTSIADALGPLSAAPFDAKRRIMETDGEQKPQF